MKAIDSPWTQQDTMPGWGIVADLTPPELIAKRRLTVVRRLVVAGVITMLLLCGAGFGYATWQHGKAEDGLAAEQLRTTTLLSEQRKYSSVTVVRGAIGQVQDQLAGLMSGDVDTAALVHSIVDALPATMTIDQMTVTISVAGTSGDRSGTTGGIGSLDLTGATHIGTVALSGTGAELTDLAGYVRALQDAKGVFEPYPLSNQATDTGTTYSLQLTLTDALLTHRYETQDGAK
jgi:hypothetical protein